MLIQNLQFWVSCTILPNLLFLKSFKLQSHLYFCYTPLPSLWSRSQPSVLPSSMPQICSQLIVFIQSFLFRHPSWLHAQPPVNHASSLGLADNYPHDILFHSQPFSMKLGHIPFLQFLLCFSLIITPFPSLSSLCT